MEPKYSNIVLAKITVVCIIRLFVFAIRHPACNNKTILLLIYNYKKHLSSLGEKCEVNKKQCYKWVAVCETKNL